ncbi:MAG: Npun_R1517 family heterocyst differentiation transcriptional regulator [Cyanobacteria bacterium P01_H01_bin.119]
MTNSVSPINHPSTPNDAVGVYECEIRLKFRLIEESAFIRNKEELIQFLVDAYAYGSDDYMESLDTEVTVNPIQELNASPQMRRQLIRLRSTGN